MSADLDLPNTGLRDFSLKNVPKSEKFDVKALSESELLVLRDQIDERLPILRFQDLNLEEELLRQYQRVRALQNDIQNGEGVPANQRAQVANSASRLLGDIVKMQHDLYNAEQFKKMEACLGKALKNAPKEVQEAFFHHYEKSAEEMANAGPGALS